MEKILEKSWNFVSPEKTEPWLTKCPSMWHSYSYLIQVCFSFLGEPYRVNVLELDTSGKVVTAVAVFLLFESIYFYRPQTKLGARIYFHRRLSVRGGISVQGVSVRVGCLRPGESLSGWGVSVQGGLCQGDPPVRVTCGRYASYWNAFLL